MEQRPSFRMLLLRYRWIFLLAPGVLFLLFFFLFPMGELLAMSFMKYDRYRLYQAVFTWENYHKFFSDPYFIQMVTNSLLVGVYTTIFSLVIGYPVAYYLTRIRGFERTLISAACLLPIFVTILVSTLGWYIIFLPFGVLQRIFSLVGIHQGPLRWLQSFPALIAVLVYLHIPYVILILAASIENVSEEKVRAARVLGASNFRVFQQVVIPLTLPGIVASAILVFADAVSSYLVPILITGQKISLLPIAIFHYTADLLNWPFASAIAVLLLVIVLAGTYGFTVATNRLSRRGKWEMV